MKRSLSVDAKLAKNVGLEAPPVTNTAKDTAKDTAATSGARGGAWGMAATHVIVVRRCAYTKVANGRVLQCVDEVITAISKGDHAPEPPPRCLKSDDGVERVWMDPWPTGIRCCVRHACAREGCGKSKPSTARHCTACEQIAPLSG